MAGFMILVTATSAASSLALLRNCPSYQNLAARFSFLMVTVADQAVRPPRFSVSAALIDEPGRIESVLTSTIRHDVVDRSWQALLTTDG